MKRTCCNCKNSMWHDGWGFHFCHLADDHDEEVDLTKPACEKHKFMFKTVEA